MYPQRFLKQVISMFCSTYNEFTNSFPEIRKLLLDKNNKKLDKSRIKITMYLLKNYIIQYSGMACICYSDCSIRSIASIDAYPLDLLLRLIQKIILMVSLI